MNVGDTHEPLNQDQWSFPLRRLIVLAVILSFDTFVHIMLLGEGLKLVDAPLTSTHGCTVDINLGQDPGAERGHAGASIWAKNTSRSSRKSWRTRQEEGFVCTV